MVFIPLAVTAASWLLQDRGARNFEKTVFSSIYLCCNPSPNRKLEEKAQTAED